MRESQLSGSMLKGTSNKRIETRVSMNIDPQKVYAVTYSIPHDRFEIGPLSAWLDTDMKLFIERTTSKQGWLLLSVHDSHDEAQERMNQLQGISNQHGYGE